MVDEPLPPEFQFGKVVGRVIRAVADTADDIDALPQARPAAGTVTFTPRQSLRVITTPGDKTFVTSAGETANLSAAGRVIDAEGRQGIWLVTGTYDVKFDLTGGMGLPSMVIEVTTDHTDDAPLDLVDDASYIPPPRTPVQTLLVPVGGADGDVLSRSGTDLAWVPDSAPDATTSDKGLVRLSGDLGGTADAPTVPALADKADTTAVTAAINTAITNLINGAPGALDTLNELATQLGSDESAAAALTTLVGAIRNLTDSTHVAALSAAFLPKWQPRTAYTSGQIVVAPDGSIVKRLTPGTSGSSYTSTNWQTVATVAGTQVNTELGGWFETRRRVDLSSSFSYGAPTDGTNASAAIQAAINDGVPIKFGNKGSGPGETLYDVQSVVHPLSGTDIEIDLGAVIVKDTVGGTIFANADQTVSLEGFHLAGPGRLRAKDFTKTGSLLKIRANDAVYDSPTIDKWAGGRAMDIAGDNVRVLNPRIFGSDGLTGSGGIRFFFGKGFRCIGFNIESGDDVAQFVPSGNPADPWWNAGDIEDGAYIGGYGISFAAKLMVAAQQTNTGAGGDVSLGMSVGIHGIRWIGIGGKGNAGIIRIANLNSTGTIEDVRAVACSGDASISSQVARTAHILVSRSGSATGIVDDVKIDCRVRNPQYSTAKIIGGCTNVVIEDPIAVRGAQGADLPVLDLTGEVEVRGGDIDGAGSTTNDVISVAPNDQFSAPVRALIRPHRVRGIGDGRAGVLFSGVTRPRASGAAFSPSNPASTTAIGVKVASSTTNAVIEGNDLSALASAVPVNDAGTETLVSGNVGVADKGGTYQTAWSAWATKTAAYAAQSNDQLLLDTTGGTFAVSLPVASANRISRVRLKWVAGTTPPTLAGSTNDPNWGGFTDLGDSFEFVDDGTTYWAV